MPLTNIFKRKKAPAPKQTEQQTPESPREVLEKPAKTLLSSPVLRHPHMTEKTAGLGTKQEYVFVVLRSATKTQVKEEVERRYGKRVQKVRTISIPPKSRRIGRFEGIKKGYKKAIVRLEKGATIETI